MNRFKFYLAVGLAFTLALLPNLPMTLTTVGAQTIITDTSARDLRFHGQGYGAVSTVKGMLVKYTGPEPCSTVEVGAGGDITFLSGPCGALVADTTLECPVSGANGGVFDLSTPAAGCDTMGEVVDNINLSTGWRAVLVNVLRSDATDNVFITRAAVSATTAKGVALLIDSTIALNITVSPGAPDDDIRFYMTGTVGTSSTAPPSRTFNPNPFNDRIYRALEIVDTVTTGGAATVTALCVKESLGTGTNRASSQTVRTIWTEAGGATTAQHTKVWPFLECEKGERLMFRNTCTTSLTVANIFGAASSRLAVAGR